MLSFWLAIYLVLAAVSIVQAVLATVEAVENRRFARQRLRELPFFWPRGRVSVFVPCKGVDVGLEENLRAVLRQDHPDYEVVFIVESEDDPACDLIHRLIAQRRRADARLVVAGLAADCAQKVHNLREATGDLNPEIRYLAFMDSDARPRPEWLRSLVLRLSRPQVGAVTGYRWFVPERPTAANYVLSAINAVVAMLCGPGKRHLVWGGSWAIRRELFEQAELREAWAGRIVDDVVASHVLSHQGYGILYHPACLVPSPLDVSWPRLLGFIRRQYFLVRFHFGRWWLVAHALVAAANLVLALNLAALAAACLGLLPAAAPLGVTALLVVLGIFRAWTRQDMARECFPLLHGELRAAGWVDLLAHPLGGLVHWVGLIGSALGREIAWRGIRYRVERDGSTVEVRRDGQPSLRILHPDDASPEPAFKPPRRKAG